jgi:hypothetical protein
LNPPLHSAIKRKQGDEKIDGLVVFELVVVPVPVVGTHIPPGPLGLSTNI